MGRISLRGWPKLGVTTGVANVIKQNSRTMIVETPSCYILCIYSPPEKSVESVEETLGECLIILHSRRVIRGAPLEEQQDSMRSRPPVPGMATESLAGQTPGSQSRRGPLIS